MFKKEYKKPYIKVVELENTDILATSGDEPNSQFEEIDIDNNPYNGPLG